MQSLPTGGAWIETSDFNKALWSNRCRSPRGERGLKQTVKLGTGIVGGRSPRGERGLKHLIFVLLILIIVAPHVGSVD